MMDDDQRLRLLAALLVLLTAGGASYLIIRLVDNAGTGFASLGVVWACAAALLLVLTEEEL